MISLTSILLPFAIVSTGMPITLPTHDEVCVELASISMPDTLIIDTGRPAIFYKNGTILVMSTNGGQSYFEGTAAENRARYCE